MKQEFIHKGLKLLVLAFFGCAVLFSGCEKYRTPEKLALPEVETDSVTDIQGNVYKTVKIGNQWWMAENLKVSLYRNGDRITQIYNDPEDWSEENEGAYCFFNEDRTYGFLYNWHAVHDPRGIAPAGWHVATDEDWKELELFIGFTAPETDYVSWRGTGGGKLKTTTTTYGTSTWIVIEDLQNTNETGFSALPGGCRVFNGSWGVPGIFYTGFWWSATEQDNESAWYRYMDYQYDGIFRYFGPKTYGFSVRCVKD
jgi:uncharacterized protein (TIGR02145 family)